MSSSSRPSPISGWRLTLHCHHRHTAAPCRIRLPLCGNRWQRCYAELQPTVVVVQGDTSSAYAGALAARDLRIPLAHVEAGLRTANPMRPFPEEAFRRRIAPIAQWHFAPTQGAAMNLFNEGIARSQVHVVGNTVIDELRLRSTADPTKP